MDLKSSKTYENLKKAFAGESQARNKYTYFSSIARKEGYQQIADFYELLAKNEKEHAKIWYKFLNDGDIGSTVQNLKDSIDGEHEEWTSMYKEFEQTAKEEGFLDIAEKFSLTAKVEKAHEGKLTKYLSGLENGKLHRMDTDVIWVCKNCGYIHCDKEAPESCPLCAHPRGYFEIQR